MVVQPLVVQGRREVTHMVNTSLQDDVLDSEEAKKVQDTFEATSVEEGPADQEVAAE